MAVKKKYQFKTLKDMINSDEYQIYESESLSLQSNIINRKFDPEIVTNGDIIESWKYYLNNIIGYDISIKNKNHINAEINKIEKYHITHNTYDEIVYDYAEG